MTRRIAIIDSHTGGEPTRVVVSGGPDLGSSSIAERQQIFREKFDNFRSAIVNEPRGSNAMVGALLCAPSDSTCIAGVIYFNNVGFLGMCGHGTIGLIVTLAHMGKIQPGQHRIETSVGIVTATLNADGSVTIENVPSYRKAKNVKLQLQDAQEMFGDVAWGGNWFLLVDLGKAVLEIGQMEGYVALCRYLRQTINAQGFPEVDHVELFGAPYAHGAHSSNFVLCPGNAYDRSPCGTGTSAKLACLAADGKLAEGAEWIQESIIGSSFRGSFRWIDREKGIIAPTITGTAYINAEATLILHDEDPFCWGIH